MQFHKVKKLHFMGIGGSGMCGMAEILYILGFEISGCDKVPSPIIEHLKEIGIPISIGHSSSHLKGIDTLVFSSAVPKDIEEIKEAKKRKIPTISRAELLAQMVRLGFSICVAGTHGKTTTTSLIGHLLIEMKADPTVIVGGRVKNFSGHSRLGESNFFVLEADEYDRSFLQLIPDIAVITTIDEDHLDTYGNFKNICDAFYNFAQKVPFYGSLILFEGDREQKILAKKLGRPFLTYGFSEKANLWAEKIKGKKGGMEFIINLKGRKYPAFVPLYGKHNVQNTLAAVLAVLELGYDIKKIIYALKTFPGISRRMDLIGYLNGAPVIDDYAHHPKEISETLKGLKLAFPSKKIIVVFQPHLYSRTLHFKKEFAKALKKADLSIIFKIYPAREKPIRGVSGLIILKELKKIRKNCFYIDNYKDLKEFLFKNVKKENILVFMGAGDITYFAHNLIKGGNYGND